MWGSLLGLAGIAGTRLALALVSVAVWLISRPGGWAVLVAAALVGVKLLPKN